MSDEAILRDATQLERRAHLQLEAASPGEADLAAHLMILEQRAGVRERIDEVRLRPSLGLFGTDMLRQRIRRAYFGVTDVRLRLELIRTAYTLDRQARFSASANVCRSRDSLKQSRASAHRISWSTGLPVAAACLAPACSGLGFAVQLAGTLAVLGCGWFLMRMRRRSIHQTLEVAAMRLSDATQHARQVWQRPMLFTRDEATGGPESIEFGRQSSAWKLAWCHSKASSDALDAMRQR